MNDFKKKIEVTNDQFFPKEMNNEVHMVLGTSEEVIREMTDKWHMVFEGKMSAFKKVDERNTATSLLKDFHKHEMSFFFLFKNNKNENVGWAMCEVEDYMTMYIRNFGILSEYRRKKVYSSFIHQLEKYAYELGFERITSHNRGYNLPVLTAKLKLGFVICGYEYHESWGQSVKMVKHLYKDRKEHFLESSR